MNIKAGDKVRINKDIYRSEIKEGTPYARKDDSGEVAETFKGGVDGSTWYAKVLFGSILKTFRLTSVEKLASGMKKDPRR